MIPEIRINGNIIQIPRIGEFIGTNAIRDVQVSDVRIPTTRIYTPTVIPPEQPVVINIGKPIVDMPGCVKVHKENVRQRSKNKMLVDDDPKGNTVLCDNGMPYYEPPDYQQNRLTWTTVTPKEPEADGINTEQPDIPTPEVPGTPKIPPTKEEEKECPGPRDLRVGDFTTSKDEKVIGHEWNSDETICITLYEDVTWVDKYLPSPSVVTTTGGIALVATSSALLAKPLADLLLKVIKPLVKKVVAKVKTILGKTEKSPSLSERRNEQRIRNRAILTLRNSVKK
tara:strand:- start:276 stop:1124 length:849 start_codon:yes stop_codon:yes gene_type:complete